LHKAGWAVTEAGNGRVALGCLAEAQPAVILLDLMMPEMDGFTFLEELHKVASWQAIPVIVVSAKDITPADQCRLNSAVTAILQKGSYTCDGLLQQVRDLVQASVPSLQLS
jgi:CheY-like chemotaxis protein